MDERAAIARRHEACRQLAEAFLRDTLDVGDTLEEIEVKRLAQCIQESIEEWLLNNGYMG
jgi:Mn-dependent DtxR family transcriptional regulator